MSSLYFDPLKNALKAYMGRGAIKRVEKAYLLAEKAHEGQLRKTGEPYIMHPAAVATLLADLQLDEETIMAALLHDVLEDTLINKDELRTEFGEKVSALVDGVSKLTHITFPNKIEEQAENVRKMVLAMAKDIRVLLIKLADRLHNMKTMESIRYEKKQSKAKETLEVYVPLANRLGMHKLRIALEDACFEVLHPFRTKVIKKAIDTLKGNRSDIINAIQKSILSAGKKYKFKHLEVIGREKHLFSIYRKMKTKKLKLTEIMDIYAFRILVSTPQECYMALGVVHELYKPVPERFKDYIALPKTNGYQSLHTTVFGAYGLPIEIQIRTLLMDDMAENGIAAHWLYKTRHTGLKTQTQIRAEEWMKELLELQRRSQNSVEFLDNIKTDLFPRDIYVFTPQGKVIELPEGSTPVDFAYALHTDIGNHCIACKIDRQVSLLNTLLSNGQTIEILTDEQSSPQPGWLDFVVTGRAKSAIRYQLNHQKNEELIKLGEILLDNALQNLYLSHDSIPAITKQMLLKKLSEPSWNTLLEKIGSGELQALIIARRLQEILSIDAEPKEELKEEPVLIRGAEGIAMKFAACCYPIPGDPIVARLLQNEGIIVHKQNCQELLKEYEGSKQSFSIAWKSDIAIDFFTKIAVDIDNQKGVLANLTKIIAAGGSSIENVDMQNPNELYRRIVFLVTIHHTSQLEKIIQDIKKVPTVISVERL
jgi:guanosine-3',5'-bis(diphosphate) 3'-pyrophosphohydrolase